MESPRDVGLGVVYLCEPVKGWRQYARQVVTFILCWLCPPYGFYLQNRRMAEMQREIDEGVEMSDDLIAMMLQKHRI